MFKLRQLQRMKQEELKHTACTTASASTATTDPSGTTGISAAYVRLQKDIDDLDLPPTVDLVGAPKQRGKQHVLSVVISPDEGFYEGGHFKFELAFNDNYPIEPPKVLCLNRIYHPNIDLEGKVCLNILREDWSPALDLQSVIVGLLFLFLEPNPRDPLNKDAAACLIRDRWSFRKLVRKSMTGATIDGITYDCVSG